MNARQRERKLAQRRFHAQQTNGHSDALFDEEYEAYLVSPEFDLAAQILGITLIGLLLVLLATHLAMTYLA